MFLNKIHHRSKYITTVSRRMASSKPTPIVELREYHLHPEHVSTYLQATTEKGELRKSLAPLRSFSMSETGGTINVATHLYYFEGGFEERTEKRGLMGKNPDFKAYLQEVKPCMINQKSTIFREATLVTETKGVCGLAPGKVENVMEQILGKEEGGQSGGIIEIRRYQLKLGYDTVPRFLKLYADGLPSKLSAPGTDPSTTLVTLMYSEVGQLNEVIEIWRHGSTSAMEGSRVAARSAKEWRDAISKIADLANVFTSSIHKPLAFSPLR